ncbi:MAG: hypothetical protein US54_C0029G0007 [Candidatus Roizmanbacteria bacterium GW2011_GWA2_37_7]|uniref:Replication-relaxation n=1 Tax=Candidatus Roizmanbacteria bacterium GW2011_GWA2_37_7 TaxID=1618481 RepID=A0A0G0HGK0_9BACT|nr:MAG: hypothetical protein US54_C0029G0007 [Candidatus Roizmanbacteria bacterium GW2011_GWA2_37_7]
MNIPSITKKQKLILYLLYKFRFLNRVQIQTLLHHKTYNRINAWLKDLTEKNYVGRKLETESEINAVPAVYYLKNNGMQFVKTQPYCEKAYIAKLYQEDTRSKKFIANCLLIADIYLDLLKKCGKKSGFAFCTRSDYTLDGIIKEIFPHFVFQKGKTEPYFTAEIFPEKPRFFILNRIKKYTTFFTAGDWIKQEKLPTILFICPNDEIEEYVVKKVKVVCRDENITGLIFQTTTQEQIKKLGITGDVWSEVDKTYEK